MFKIFARLRDAYRRFRARRWPRQLPLNENPPEVGRWIQRASREKVDYEIVIDEGGYVSATPLPEGDFTRVVDRRRQLLPATKAVELHQGNGGFTKVDAEQRGCLKSVIHGGAAMTPQA